MDDSSDPRSEDWGMFGRPLFNDPSSRALSRVGVVDVGSNSVRMVVFDGAARSPAYFFNEKVMCGLGAGLSESGRLNPEGKTRALAAIRRFCLLAEGMGATPLTAVATAAMREAGDGPDFCQQVLDETGLKLWVIDGAEEARLSAQGVLLGWPEADGLVCDIGGSSMELAEVSKGEVGKRLSSPLGPLKLRDVPGGKKGLAKHIAKVIDGLAETMGTDHARLYLVGGSWRAIARLDMTRRGYPLTVLHEYRMPRASILETLDWIAENDPDALRSRAGIGAERMSLVPIAAEVLRRLVQTLNPKEICVSSYGIREGMLFEQMPEQLRRRDPLIEACYFTESISARMPGFGRRLFKFILPLYEGAPPELLRLVKAACLLHDTAWRAHPDYRHEVCFDAATRANLGGLDHEGRVFLGLALLHRYKNKRSGSRFEPLFELLSEQQIKGAEVLGKAMRFGAMFSSDEPDQFAKLRYAADHATLELALAPGAEALYGEVAEARLASLAKSLGTEIRVIRAG